MGSEMCIRDSSNSRTREYVQEGEREGKSLTDAMEDGSMDGMQTFDRELERLILSGVLDRELALSYATNRTNLQLRLDTQGSDFSAQAAAKKPAPPPPPPRRSSSPGTAPAPAAAPKSDFDDLIER